MAEMKNIFSFVMTQIGNRNNAKSRFNRICSVPAANLLLSYVNRHCQYNTNDANTIDNF